MNLLIKKLQKEVVDNPKFRDELLAFLVKDLFKTISENDFLVVKGSRMYYQGELLNISNKREIIQGAKLLQQLPIWKAIFAEMKYLTNKKMFEESKNFEDMQFGKAMLWCLEVIEKKVQKLSELPT